MKASAVPERPPSLAMRDHVIASFSKRHDLILKQIAEAVLSQEEVRNQLLTGTRHETAYANAKCLDA